jgi:DNA polymerase-3 subunit epsilon
MTREIALDTETTGLDPNSGHRIVEIGCVELHNHIPTGKTWQRYMNPERPMPVEAFQVHGLSDEFLAREKPFAEIVGDFLEFIGDAPLVIHNAGFDMRFLNAELTRLGFAALPMSRSIDTVQLARSRHPGAQANLYALCRRYNIDNSKRAKHGALLDAELLAEVYLELIGGRQADFGLAGDTPEARQSTADTMARPGRAARPHAPDAGEIAAHAAFIARLDRPIWEN